MVATLKRKTVNVLFPRDTHPELPLDPDALRPGEYKWPLHFTPGAQLIVFGGGCLGTFARYEVGSLLPTRAVRLPYSTLLINLVGALLLGLLLEGLARQGADTGRRRLVRLGVGTGFMGAFTTYSTLAVETSLLSRQGHIGLACVYAMLSIGGGLVCSAAGIHFAATYHKGVVK